MTMYLFVYGTLLPGIAPRETESVIARLKPISPATMPGRLYDLGEYPGAVLDATAETRIRGHVLQLPAAGDLLQRIDRYEGFYPADPARSLFLRVKQTVTLASGSPLECWVYVLRSDPGDAPLVSGGDYLAWIGGTGERA